LSDNVGRAERERIWADESFSVVVATYAGLVSLHKQNKTIESKLVQRTGELFDTIVADESSEIRNPESKAFQILGQLAHLVRFRYPMTGTPFSKDALGLWTQFYFTDPKRTPLTSSFGVYRSLFFTQVKMPYKTVYALSADKRVLLHQVIKDLSIRYEEKECNSLPEKQGGVVNPLCIPVHLHAQQSQLIERTLAEMRDAMKDQAALMGGYVRMRRAASGYMEIPGTGEFRQFAENPKLDACIDLLHQMGDERCVVVTYYKETSSIIEQRLREEDKKAKDNKTGLKFTCSKIIGGMSDSKKSEDDFRSGVSRVLILSTAGAMGLNLQFCRFMIVFESPNSLDDAVQIEKRIHRTGQTQHVVIYHLISPVDRKILEGLRDSKSVLDCVLDGASQITQSV
jgi:SNF2 family DNA or RNA helicase